MLPRDLYWGPSAPGLAAGLAFHTFQWIWLGHRNDRQPGRCGAGARRSDEREPRLPPKVMDRSDFNAARRRFRARTAAWEPIVGLRRRVWVELSDGRQLELCQYPLQGSPTWHRRR